MTKSVIVPPTKRDVYSPTELFTQSDLNFKLCSDSSENLTATCDMCGKRTQLEGSYVSTFYLTDKREQESGNKRRRFVACSEKCLQDFTDPKQKVAVEEYVNLEMDSLRMG
jgi:hypothetical protein